MTVSLASMFRDLGLDQLLTVGPGASRVHASNHVTIAPSKSPWEQVALFAESLCKDRITSNIDPVVVLGGYMARNAFGLLVGRNHFRGIVRIDQGPTPSDSPKSTISFDDDFEIPISSFAGSLGVELCRLLLVITPIFQIGFVRIKSISLAPDFRPWPQAAMVLGIARRDQITRYNGRSS